MLIPRLFVAAVRRPLPLGRDIAAPFLPWIVAVLVYVAGLSGLGLVIVDDALRAAERSVAARLTVQVPAAASDARLQTVIALLRQAPGVASVQLLTPADTARLVEPWLGAGAPLDQLPVPRLIDVTVDPSGRIDLTALRRQLASVVSEARVDDPRLWPEAVRGAARPIRIVLGAGIAAALLSVAVLTAFATRAALIAQRPAVELLHLVGAEDDAIVWPLTLRALRLAVVGAAIGDIAILLSVAALGHIGAVVQLASPTGGLGLTDWRLWTLLVGQIVVTGLLVIVSTRGIVLRRLAEMP